MEAKCHVGCLHHTAYAYQYIVSRVPKNDGLLLCDCGRLLPRSHLLVSALRLAHWLPCAGFTGDFIFVEEPHKKKTMLYQSQTLEVAQSMIDSTLSN